MLEIYTNFFVCKYLIKGQTFVINIKLTGKIMININNVNFVNYILFIFIFLVYYQFNFDNTLFCL